MSAQTRRRRRSSGSVTLRDVAARAGVAMMTASRALNAPETVSEALRARVEAAARQLGYVGNRYARGLASDRTQLITVIVPSVSGRVFADIVRGADQVLKPQGYQILVSNTAYSLEEEEEVCRRVLGWRPDGVIVSGIDHTEGARRLLAGSGVPVVEALELGPEPIDINVGISHYEAGRAAGSHLVGTGRRRLGFVGAQMDLDFRARRRRDGFLAALAEADLALAHEGSYAQPTSFELGARAITDLAARGASVDALFCVNDELAIGAVLECLRRGIAVPDAVAIIGFNDLDISGQLVPALTTVRSPRERIGRVAAQAILDRLDGTRPEADSVDVGFELIVRETT